MAAELAWLRSEGPTSPSLINHLRRQGNAYDYCLFFSYRYYHAYHGIRVAGPRAVLVPTAERDPALGLRIFGGSFRGVRALMYNSYEERALISAVSNNDAVPSVVVGIGSEVPEHPEPQRFRQATGIEGPVLVYVGRIDENKGCRELFDYFQCYAHLSPQLTLVLIGTPVMPIPTHSRIRHLGYVTDEEKFDAMAAADLLVMPSHYESLSMVTLEAWALGRPVLANGRCDVLCGQCIRSNGGLYYESYEEFAETLHAIVSNSTLRNALGMNGRAYFNRHYTWPGIERKYLDMLDRLEHEDAGQVNRPEPLPSWFGPAPTRLTARPAGRGPAAHRTGGTRRRHTACRSFSERLMTAGSSSTSPAVHQVLATLGYGDAIGNEALSIQAVLRTAGYASEIFVETADPRLEPLTRDCRDLIDASHPDNILIHHFSLGSRASRVAYALPDRMVLVYHNITPPEYFVGVHKDLVRLCYSGRARGARLREPVRPCAGRLGVQPPRTGPVRVPTHGRAPGRRGPGPPGRDTGPHPGLGVRRRTDQHPVRRSRHPEQTDRGRHPLLSGVSGLASPRRPAAVGGRLRRVRVVSRLAPSPDRDPARAGRAHHGSRLERRTDRVLRRGRPVPVGERARGLLCAARRGFPQADTGARLRCGGGAGDDGRRRASCTRQRTPDMSPQSWTRCCPAPRSSRRIVRGQDAALDRLLARGLRGGAVGCRRPGNPSAPAPTRRGPGGTSGNGSRNGNAWRSCVCLARPPTRRCPSRPENAARTRSRPATNDGLP